MTIPTIPLTRPSAGSSTWLRAGILAMLLAAAACLPGAEPAAAPGAPGTAAAGLRPSTDHLMAGDLLQVQVYDNPDLACQVRVPVTGAVEFPLIGPLERIDLMTSEGLAGEISQRLERSFLNRAVVTVTVTQFGPRQGFVLGRVAHPGAYPLDPSQASSVARAISQAGGLLDDADSRNIVVLRTGANDEVTTVPVVLGTAATLADVPLRANDLIMVPGLERIYITGQVKQPGSIPSNAPNLTIARALSQVGGFDTYARTSSVELLRAGQPVTVIDVAAILSGKAPDLPLAPGDMVNVPERRY